MINFWKFCVDSKAALAKDRLCLRPTVSPASDPVDMLPFYAGFDAPEPS